ncbi:hypothetical protein KKB18_12615 [bacterium]|nr:hypothetical protein [bacterium]
MKVLLKRKLGNKSKKLTPMDLEEALDYIAKLEDKIQRSERLQNSIIESEKEKSESVLYLVEIWSSSS